MSNEAIGRKLTDLRVLDLKEELEKRSLEVTGIKNALIERLQKALREEGHDPETYVFESLEKRTPAKKGQARTSKQEKPPILEVIEIKGEPEDPDEVDEVVDEVGTVDQEQHEEVEPEEANNDSTINDNDESINLTIEEDEEKLLHAQAPDDKDKSKTANKTTGVSCGSHGEENGKVGDAAGKSDKDEDQRDKKETTGAEETDDKKTKTEDEKKKGGEDSEQKSSSKTTSTKDEKDKTASGAKSKSSSSSRNLWVSGLSSLTRASDLKTIFSKYGKVIGAKVVTNTRTPGTRCYGYVTMSSSADASKCIEHLHRTELHGRIISVERTKSEIGSSNQSSKTEAAKHTSKSRDREKVKEGEKAPEKEVEVGKKAEPAEEKAKSVTSRRSNHKSRSSRDRNNEKRRTTDRERERTRDILSFQKIREERERQRLREKERELRQEERRRREIRRKQREEEQRLAREREKLQLEREKLEREKAELLRLERERQKLEREKIELERLELKRQQMKIIHSSRVEESKRSLKRPSDDRYTDSDRKRSTSDRRFEPPPPPRFDSSLTSYDRSSDKKRDDYVSSKRDDYSKRDIDVPRHSSNYQSSRDSHKESRYTDNEPRSSNFRRSDDRDGGSRSSGSKRFESSSYADRTTSGSGSQWHNSGPTSIKSFGGSNMPSSGSAGITNWTSKSSDNHWRPVDSSHDRYDRTYNERSGGGQYIEPSRQGMFVGRPQDRYGGQTSSRYENGKY